MIEIPLTRGHVAMIDDADAALAAFSWFAHINQDGSVYAVRDVRREGRIVRLQLHREVLGLKRGDPLVDHRDGNGLDCRRANLRPADRKTNARNSKVSANNSSGFQGVVWHRTISRWTARIVVDQRHIHIGTFKTADEANIARLTAERELWGVQPRREEAFRKAGLL